MQLPKRNKSVLRDVEVKRIQFLGAIKRDERKPIFANS